MKEIEGFGNVILSYIERSMTRSFGTVRKYKNMVKAFIQYYRIEEMCMRKQENEENVNISMEMFERLTGFIEAKLRTGWKYEIFIFLVFVNDNG